MPLDSFLLRALLLATACLAPTSLLAAAREKAAPAPAAPAPLVVDEGYAPLLEDSGGGLVLAAALFDDGRAAIGGTFEFVNDTSRRYFAWLRADGSLDPQSLDASAPDGPVLAIAPQPEGAVLVGGDFRHVGAQFAAGLVRLKANGMVDETFRAPTRVNGRITVLAIQTDGKILVGGEFDSFAGTSVPGFVRLLPDGLVDDSFHPDVAEADRRTVITSIAVLPDGGMAVVAAQTASVLPILDPASRPVDGLPATTTMAARLRADGSRELTFQRQVITALNPTRVFVLSTGELMLAGSGELQRLDTDGTVDGRFRFKEQGAMQVNAAAALPDGRIIVGGSVRARATLPARLLVVDRNGQIESRYAMPRDENHAIATLARNGRGRLLAAGRVSPAAARLTFSKTENRVLLLDERLAVDSRFRARVGASAHFSAATLDGRGGLILAGAFKANDGLTGAAIVRLLRDGSEDRSFRPGGQLAGLPQALVAVPDGSVVIAGIYNPEIEIKKPRPVLRLRADGSTDPDFLPDIPLTGSFSDSALLADGTVTLVGPLTGRTPDRTFGDFVRFDLRGRVDRRLAETVPSWFAGSTGRLIAVAATASGHVFIGGEFGKLQDRPRSAFARIGTEGIVDPTFTPQTDDFSVVAAIAPLTDQRVFIDGWAKPAPGASPLVRRFARLQPDGRRDSSYAPPDFGPRQAVLARMLADGTTLVVFYDPADDAAERFHLGRLDRAGRIMPDFDVVLGNHGMALRILPAADDSVYLVGDVASLNHSPRHGLARLVPRR